jgi:hypothetical protein
MRAIWVLRLFFVNVAEKGILFQGRREME